MEVLGNFDGGMSLSVRHGNDLASILKAPEIFAERPNL